MDDGTLAAIEERHEEDGRLVGKDPDKTVLLAEVKAGRKRERRLQDGIERLADHADRLTHLPAFVIASDLRALLDDDEEAEDG